MNVTLRQLRAFVAVGELGGFTAAAERLHVTQSALSVTVRSLERELGLRLFDRTTRSVELTAAGREFYPLAQKTLEDLTSAVEHSRDLAELKRGRVTVAATTVVSSILLPPAVARFNRDFPGIRVVLRDGAVPAQIAHMVAGGEADIGIAPTALAPSELDATLFMEDTLELACARQHPLARKTRVTWRDLAGESLIALSGDDAIRQIVEERLRIARIRTMPAFEVAFLSTAMGLVDAGLGVAVLPSHARALARLHRVRFMKLVAPVVRRDVQLLTQRDRALSPAAARFRAFLLERLRPRVDLPRSAE
ncbi:MAG TPA: LysR family transcriptional regulator [Casimicrobiaceae bacterium]|nr:LysR family transcriptional regulator [Casimicrobiaceae bacterium]